MMAGDKKQARQERARRRAICVACPFVTKTLIKLCSKCNCPIVLKTAGSCPDNRW